MFTSLEQSSAAQAFIHETIERSEEEKEAYDHWKTKLAHCDLINWLHDQYVQHTIQKKHSDEAIDFLSSPSIEGFVVDFSKKKYSKIELIHLFDLLKERVLDWGYILYMSDLRSYAKSNGVETVQRHYLKPRMRVQDFSQPKINQQFGNITIQLIERDDRVRYLKFNATKYSDHLYQEAAAYDELLKTLFV